MRIHNPFMIFMAFIQILGALWFWLKLGSPLLGLLQVTYAMSNIIISLMKGM